MSPAEALRRETLTLLTGGGSHVIDVEIAETREEKARGLMDRSSLPEKAGMLFIYTAPRELTMWMKNTPLSLDMVFIRADGVVHRIEQHTVPNSETLILSRGAVLGVLELNAGEGERLGLKAGDRVAHPTFQPGWAR